MVGVWLSGAVCGRGPSADLTYMVSSYNGNVWA